jgi:adenosine deaminase
MQLCNSLTRLITLPLLFSFAISLNAQSKKPSRPAAVRTAEQKTAKHFESLRKSPPQMFAFLKQMPKGGDLHSHLTGSIYAESFIQWSAKNGLCVNQTTFFLSAPPCDQSAGQVAVSAALPNIVLYRQLIDAWSMRFWEYSGQSGHDHFFDAFARFGPATFGQFGPMFAEVASRAAKGRVTYLELMLTADGGMSGRIGRQIGWDGNFESTLNKVKSNGLSDAIAAGIKAIKDGEAEKNRILNCETPQADAGCSVTVRYIMQVARGDALGAVFAQMVTGLELANDPQSKVVAINLVQPEDWLMSMQNFSVQMEMLSFLRPRYSKGHITLHAGELAPGMVPPEGLSFHIRDSVAKGHAERIGHGVDIMHEDKPYDLLKELARRKIMIEICLTSNESILGITKEGHPLATYLQYDVPVALATDDEGVSRSEISNEYLKAAQDQGLGYLQLKKMARASLQYAFLQGASLWSDSERLVPVSLCANDLRASKPASSACKQYLSGSEKATLQWQLEEDFRKFENQY